MKIPDLSKFSKLERILVIVNVITVSVIISDKLIFSRMSTEANNNEIEELVCPSNYSNAGGGYCSANLCITPRGDRCSYGQQMLPGQIIKRKIAKEGMVQ
jgi:hypothetical protein